MAKKYDPRMHTAEHILNQTMDRLFACGRCFSAHVNPDKAKCDYHFDRDLSADEARDIQARVNAVIEADLPVFAETMARADAEERFDLGRLPDDAPDTLRVVRIGINRQFIQIIFKGRGCDSYYTAVPSVKGMIY